MFYDSDLTVSDRSLPFRLEFRERVPNFPAAVVKKEFAVVIEIFFTAVFADESDAVAVGRQFRDEDKHFVAVAEGGLHKIKRVVQCFFRLLNSLCEVVYFLLIAVFENRAALFFAAIFLKEPLSALGIIGAVMIIGSAVVSEMQRAES